MNNKKTAILVDSGMDVPSDILAQPQVYVLPLQVTFKDKTYADRVDITPQQVYERLPIEVPTTALPSGELIHQTFEKIISDGYEQVLIASISSALSGTFNALRVASEDYPTLTVYTFDTKSIGIGGGIQVAYASELLLDGLPIEDVLQKLNDNIAKTKVFFSVPTLEYLKKGGRIGLVTSFVGTALNLQPVISCNTEGVYYTVGKARGRKKSLAKMLELAKATAEIAPRYDVGIAYGNCLEDAEKYANAVKSELPNIEHFYFGAVSPSLGVHTGPDVLGIAIYPRFN